MDASTNGHATGAPVAGGDAAPWIVRGKLVGLTTPDKQDYVERWRIYSDPVLAGLHGFQVGVPYPNMPTLPPFLREQREAMYDYHATRHLLMLDVRTVADGRIVGEGGWRDILWPTASGDMVLDVYRSEDRSRGYGGEAALLLCAYAFDILGLNRLTLRALALNDRVVRMVDRVAPTIGARKVGIERQALWAFGRHQDMIVVELLRDEWIPHPATAHLRALGAGEVPDDLLPHVLQNLAEPADRA